MLDRSTGLPRGSRDLLPAAARRRTQIVRVLMDVFDHWGYAPVVTPTVEFYDVLAQGLSEVDRRACVRFIAAPDGDVVALRSDVTPQIARMVGERRGVDWPADAVLRLAYAADIVRRPEGDREKTESHQVGVELVGDHDRGADAELIALGSAALRAVNVEGVRFDISHRAVARGTLDAIGLPPPVLLAVERAVARKDRGTATALVQDAGVGADVVAAVALLCDGFGPSVDLAGARALLTDPLAQQGIDELTAVLDNLRDLDPNLSEAIDVDLGEVRGFDYYTGVRMRAWVPDVSVPVLRGGRCDNLVGRYGTDAPATGFALDLDALESVAPRFASENGPALEVVTSDVAWSGLVGRRHAAREAARSRAAGRRAAVQLPMTLVRAQEVASALRADRLTFIACGAAGAALASSYVRGPSGWTLE